MTYTYRTFWPAGSGDLLFALGLVALLQRFLQLRHDGFEIGRFVRFDEIQNQPRVIGKLPLVRHRLGLLRWSGLRAGVARNEQHRAEKSKSNPCRPASGHRRETSNHRGLLRER